MDANQVMQVFSYHLARAAGWQGIGRLLRWRRRQRVAGLRHAELLLPMRMGHPVMSTARYRWNVLALLAFWERERDLDHCLAKPPAWLRTPPASTWHIRLQLYRRFGSYPGFDPAQLYPPPRSAAAPVVAVTVAKLKLSETLRFARFGRPVETQVREHPGVHQSAVAFRPPHTFSTFSVWETEQAMTDMVHGKRPTTDGTEHRNAMLERQRKRFHQAFTTLRFVPLAAYGSWPACLR